MTREKFLQLMEERPYLRRMGKGKLSRRYKVNPEDVVWCREHLQGAKKSGAKILLFDTETAPLAGWLFSRWDQNLGLDQTIHEWFMICWSAKWLGENKVMSDCLTSKEAIEQDDSRIMFSLWKLIDEADIIVAHNLNGADEKWMNTRFILNGLMPPSPYMKVDTLQVAKNRFGFSSNKLDNLATQFGIENKLKTDFNLWKGCLMGDEDCLDKMVKYNCKDTEILEQVYLRLLPWIKNHPPINVIEEDDVCPNCGGHHYNKIRDRYFITNANKYELYRCEDCGGVFRNKKALEINKSNFVKCSH